MKIDMDPNLAMTMAERGGTLIIIGMPTGTEFGIDMESWHIGEKFKGIKMIPPGLHFIYFSARNKDGQTAPRTGFFHVFQQKEVLVKKYNLKDEDLEDENNLEQLDRINLNLKNLDKDLGPYPYELWSKWISFTQYIKAEDLSRMHPLSGKICSAPELVSKEFKQKQTPSNEMDGKVDSIGPMSEPGPSNHFQKLNKLVSPVSTTPCLPDMEPRPGTEIRFSKFPEKPYKEGASPDEITKGNLDSSYTVQFIYDQLGKPENILAEIQFSFVCFLVGQVWDSWEHWRLLLAAFCKAEDNLKEYPQLYSQFLSILHFQIEEVPEDLFVDIVESSNFLVDSLRSLFANINDNAFSLPQDLVAKSRKFKTHLVSKFRWNLTLEEEDDEAPVVVDLES